MQDIGIVLPQKNKGFVQLDESLLRQAKQSGFFNEPNNPFCRLFFKLCMGDASVTLDKSNPEVRNKWDYISELVRDTNLRYSQKEAVGAYLLSQITTLNNQTDV